MAPRKEPRSPWTGEWLDDPSLPREIARGIELLNDNVTTMSFVVETLQQGLGMDLELALQTAIAIHERGASRVGRMRPEHAECIVARVHEEARKAGFPFQCRVVAATPQQA